MMRFRRPRKPADFEEAVRAQRDAVETAIAEGRAPTFDELWGAFKPAFAQAQHGKCGYCEIAVIGGQDGDVEHYAPKSELAGLGSEPATWGKEAPNSASVRGRKFQKLSDSGYSWLAYSWSNYLLACAICNRKWKKTIFPVKEPPSRTVPPAKSVLERALLLNPFSGAHPAKHLHFGDDGSVVAWRNSRYGLETIKTVGLDRPSIRKVRLPFVEDAYQTIREFVEAGERGDAAAQTQALRDLARLGRENRQFSGAVRAIVEQVLRVRWQDVEAAAPPS